MIVVIASNSDEAAKTLVKQWQADDACLLTCEDLSVCGWRYYLDHSRTSIAMIGGREVPLQEISGVLTRLPYVLEQELLHIVPADRQYVATEMNAFLTAWLFTLPCPVFNRPSPTCLAGPNWRVERWTYVAAQVGIPIRPIQRKVTLAASASPEVEPTRPTHTSVTIIGNTHFGSLDPTLIVQARRLAVAASVDLLTVRFSDPASGSYFIGASTWPELDDEIANALIDYFRQKRVEC